MKFDRENNCILFFVRHPVAEKVKTRLAVDTGSAEAAELYTSFVSDLSTNLRKLPFPVIVCCSPADSTTQFRKWLGDDFVYKPQSGEDLGQRLRNAFEHTFDNGAEKAVVIGSDSPDLPVEYIRRGFEYMDTKDAVIGPSGDGGYYLMGFTGDSFCPEVFEDIDWGTERVFNQSRHILDSNGLSIETMPEWYDIDTYEDLLAFYNRNRTGHFANSNTMTFLENRMGVTQC